MSAGQTSDYPQVRRARITLRCLTEDLGWEIPPPDVDLGELDHPLIDEARRLAPTSPRGQKRILAIDHPLVYRIRHSNQRGATWFDVEHAVLWLLAIEKREAGSEDDAYAYFAELHRAGQLMPTPNDFLRDRVESVDRLRRAIRIDLRDILAASGDGREISTELASWIPVRILVKKTVELEEIWFALATRDQQGQGIPVRLRDYIFASLEDLTRPAEWEWRTDWPTGNLEWFEVARLGLRELPR